MGQATVDLPDPLEQPPAASPANTDDLLAQLAGDEIDPKNPGYVKVDNRLVRRLFGDFAPSRGDLVLSKTGELLGIMVNNEYCALVNNFLASQVIPTGDDLAGRAINKQLDDLILRLRKLPLRIQQ